MSVSNVLSQNTFAKFELLSESTDYLLSVYTLLVTHPVTVKGFCCLKKIEAIAEGSLVKCKVEESS